MYTYLPVRNTAFIAARRSCRRLFSTYSLEEEHHAPEEHVTAFGGSYDWEDPFLFRSQLKEEEMAVWDAARAFCQGELQPLILEANRYEKTLDHDLMRKMGDVGLLGATIPTEYGGSGLGYVSYGLIATEVERVDSSYRSAASVQSSLVMYPIFAYGTGEMKRKYLPELASGSFIGCFGLTVRTSVVVYLMRSRLYELRVLFFAHIGHT
jgi:glutaryl-CoA dehydrogenase